MKNIKYLIKKNSYPSLSQKSKILNENNKLKLYSEHRDPNIDKKELDMFLL